MPTQAPYSVLIVGGTGFVGRHLVSHFLANPTFTKVIVLSRSAATSASRLEGATYLSCDLTDYASIRACISDIKPTLIIHAASPSAVTGTKNQYKKVNLHGTQNLLKTAKQSEHVRSLIYTSSSTLAMGREHVDVDESCELANYDAKASPYARSKANAETMILHANYPKYTEDEEYEANWAGHIATASIRLPIVYGTGDTTTIPGCLNALAKGQTSTIIGDGENFWSYCSASNAATAHVFLATALLTPPSSALAPTERIAGQAFNINDGTPYPFWDFPRLCWKYAGHSPMQRSQMSHLAVWVAFALSGILEWVFWFGTFGCKRPYKLGRQQVEYMCFTHTYSIEKARQRLGFEPKGDFEEDVRRSVEWCLEEGGWRAKLRGVKGVKQE
ncbi:C-3 sterol dehydrogenase/C-4 decarboxylase-like protein [Byssothecium circinans]|uniref:C-3 sterol dehydrogenase/C-4 decarboxylase-like protein n=1 Tax=Byssothecium circinans TaxID=147558 RepID=A0A6A5UBJ0_9PLEO|nr:C-3 sterol dehydrogenase/C-4 decarboxylase-like protein [Byssothecium circinans]